MDAETAQPAPIAHSTLQVGMKIRINGLPGRVYAKTPSGNVIVRDLWRNSYILSPDQVVTLRDDTDE